MNPFSSITKSIKNLDSNIDEVLIFLLEELEEKILSLNRAQLDKGIKSDGEEITPEYTGHTKRIKRAKGQPTNRVTLKDTGDFYASFEIIYKITDKEIVLIAQDEKTRKLELKYGREIFGLTSDSLAELAPLLKADLIDFIKNQILI